MIISSESKRERANRREESGYSLLMVVFLVATSIILSAAVVPDILTQGRREREMEMVWRGEQYERAIGLYFRKFGRYPSKVDDLVKQTNGARFLRQPYTDPMNKEDGSWRFIYVGPNGQLIGSSRSSSLLQSMLTAPTTPGATPLGGPGAQDSIGAASAMGAFGAVAGPGGPAAIAARGTGQGDQAGSPSGISPNPLQSQPQPLSGNVIGGNIIGVGSKIKQSSLMIYDGGDSYEKWEFLWNPMQQVAIPGQQNPANPAAPAPGQQPQQNPQQNPLTAPGVQPQQSPFPAQ